MRKNDLTLFLLCAALWSCATAAVENKDAVELKGEWRQGNVIFGRAAPGSTVSFNGRPVQVSADGRFLIGLDRDEPPKAQLTIARAGVATDRRELEVAPRTYDVQRIDGLPPDKVTPPPAALKRIEQDYAQVRAARAQASDRDDVFGGFIWPCVGPISGVYGSQRILNGTPKQPHYGVDVAMPVGTKVVAPAGGTVTLAVPDMYYTGGTLMIEHGHGLSSAFLHLSKLHVKPGQVVKQGELIGEVGATGRVTGPHLDWRINWFDSRVDPQLLAGPMPKN
jgi:murein DD-endopeptidase MepM/ murein hydrolase activator NlpD